MVDQEIQRICESFCEKWNTAVAAAPALLLDFSWPSVSLVGHILNSLRAQDGTPSDCWEHLQGAAAYLAVMAERSWSLFDDQVSVRKRRGSVTIAAKRTPAGESKHLSVDVEQQLRLLLFPECSPESLSPAFVGCQRNPVAFALVLLSGIVAADSKSHGDQRAASATMNHMVVLSTHLAESCAGWYRRLFPEETIGHGADLYPIELIVPWGFPGGAYSPTAAAKALLDRLKAKGLNGEEMIAVCANLALCPDEEISVTALAVYAAVAERVPHTALLGLCQSRSPIFSSFRRAVIGVKSELDREGDWVLSPTFSKRERKQVEIERAMGFLPLLYLRTERLAEIARDSALRAIVLALTQGDFEHARLQLAAALRKNPADCDLALQSAFLELTIGAIPTAKEILETLRNSVDCLGEPRLHQLLGLVALAEGNALEAGRRFQQALKLCGRDRELRSTIAAGYAWTLIAVGDAAKALWALSIARRDSPFAVAPLLYKAMLQWNGDYSGIQSMFEKRLLELAPLDTRTLSHFTHRVFPRQPPLLVADAG